MSTENLHALAALNRQERDTLLARWRGEVRQLAGAHELDMPTLKNHIPDLLEELADELGAHTEESMVGELKKNSVVRGLDRLRLGFDVEEVVAEYNALRGVIQNLTERHDLSPRGAVNRIINRVIDVSIGLAVKTHAAQKDLEIQQRREVNLRALVEALVKHLRPLADASSP